MTVVAGGSRCNLITGYAENGDTDLGYGKDKWLAQTFTLNALYVVWRCRFQSWTRAAGRFYEYAIRATDAAGMPTGPDLATTTLSPTGEYSYSPGKWRRFDFDSFPNLPAGVYALIARVPTCPDTWSSKLRGDSSAPTYALGKAWQSVNGGVVWTEIPTTDLMFEVWGWEPPPIADPEPTISNWAPITIAKALVEDDYWLEITTDIPVHLFMRYTLTEPLTHATELIRRGISLPNATRFCFVVWKENEQEEAGDTLVHTFYKPDWPVCQTRWFYFIGTKQAEESPSASPIFYHHRLPPTEEIEMKILAEYASRSLYSSSGAWAATWDGTSVRITNERQAPNYELITKAQGAAPYHLTRTFMSFYLPEIPTASTILEASLSLWVLTHALTAVALCITEGQCQEPVMEDDWPLCNPYDSILGEKPLQDLVNDQYNVLSFNQAGLDWLKIAMTRSRQKESFDYTANAYFLCRDVIQLCQTFTPDQDHLLQGVKLRLKKKAGVPKIYYVDIYAVDASHHPTGPVLASGELDGNTFSTAAWGDYETFLLGSGCQVYQGLEYGIVLRSPLSNATNYAEWLTTTTGGYPAGVVVYSLNGGGTWLDNYLAYDLVFVEYNHLLPKPRQLTLRTINDVQNVATPPLGNFFATYHAAQKGVDYAPFLTIKYKPPL